MATLRQRIYSILRTAAADDSAGHLGNLLEHAETTPYGVFFINPPKKPAFPLITYSIISSAGRMPRVEAFTFTAWGASDKVGPILELIRGLLHEKSLGSTTDVKPVKMMENWIGPYLYDQNYEVYARTARYLVKGIHA